MFITMRNMQFGREKGDRTGKTCGRKGVNQNNRHEIENQRGRYHITKTERLEVKEKNLGG